MLLSIQDLKVSFRMGEGRRADAVRGVSFDVAENCTVALVGESGSGKSVTAMSVLNLLPDNAERSGRILWHPQGQEERDLLHAGTEELQTLRGKEIACVFQDPMSSLNPVFNVGQQLAEPLIKHMGLSRRAAWDRAEALLNEVGMPEPKRRLKAYPHELSGGQQQRVMIAMAIACEPKLLIADEPTTALDVTIQKQILDLIAQLQKKHQMSVLFITHDLAVVGEIADTVIVMRNGEIREQGPAKQIFENPRDTYTKALLKCRPQIDRRPVRLPVIDDFMSGNEVATDLPDRTRGVSSADPIVLSVRNLGKSF
ncbi:MAG TPA: ABC transporter ATP-binding protein, partial [Caldimonas sp.]